MGAAAPLAQPVFVQNVPIVAHARPHRPHPSFRTFPFVRPHGSRPAFWRIRTCGEFAAHGPYIRPHGPASGACRTTATHNRRPLRFALTRKPPLVCLFVRRWRRWCSRPTASRPPRPMARSSHAPPPCPEQRGIFMPRVGWPCPCGMAVPACDYRAVTFWVVLGAPASFPVRPGAPSPCWVGV